MGGLVCSVRDLCNFVPGDGDPFADDGEEGQVCHPPDEAVMPLTEWTKALGHLQFISVFFSVPLLF